MSFDIQAFNQFDPSKRAYLEIVEDNSGIEHLQLVQKSFLQVFVMWLGRIFGFGQNRSTSMKKVADFVAKHIETISIDPKLTKNGLDKFLSKINKYNKFHPNQINATVEKITEVIAKAPIGICPLADEQKSSLEAFEKALEATNQDKNKELSLVYQLSTENFEVFLENLADFKSSKLLGLFNTIDYNPIEDTARKDNFTVNNKNIPQEKCLKRLFDALGKHLEKFTEDKARSSDLHTIMNSLLDKHRGSAQDLIDHIVKTQTNKKIKVWEVLWKDSGFEESMGYYVIRQFLSEQFKLSTEIFEQQNTIGNASIRKLLKKNELITRMPLESQRNAFKWIVKNVGSHFWKDYNFISKLLEDSEFSLECYKLCIRKYRSNFKKLCSGKSLEAIELYKQQQAQQSP